MATKVLVKFNTHSIIITVNEFEYIFDAAKEVYNGVNGFPINFTMQYEDKEFGVVDLDSLV